MRRCIYRKRHYLTFGVKVTGNVTQYPLHHVICASTKFEVATSNGFGEDTITRNVTDRRTDARTDRWTTDRLWYEINIPYFSNEKAGIINPFCYFLSQQLSFKNGQKVQFQASSDNHVAMETKLGHKTKLACVQLFKFVSMLRMQY